MHSIAGFLLCAAFAVLASGCAHTSSLTPSLRDAIYERVNTHYTDTLLIKPVASDRQEFEYAPLLLQEVTPAGPPPNAPRSVFFWTTRARGLGTVLNQYNYIWFHSKEDRTPGIPQGVRITFNPDGIPIVWEVLRDPSGARVLFVSQSLEAAAMTNHPGTLPLPNRRFWVERPVSETPDVVVARILDDGPEPMGPIVYLDARTHDVGTIICRCMDAQAIEVEGMGMYRLAWLDEVAMRWLYEEKTGDLTRWLPGQPPDNLDRWLRIEPEQEGESP
jgi:hypothetical protein